MEDEIKGKGVGWLLDQGNDSCREHSSRNIEKFLSILCFGDDLVVEDLAGELQSQLIVIGEILAYDH